MVLVHEVNRKVCAPPNRDGHVLSKNSFAPKESIQSLWEPMGSGFLYARYHSLQMRSCDLGPCKKHLHIPARTARDAIGNNAKS